MATAPEQVHVCGLHACGWHGGVPFPCVLLWAGVWHVVARARCMILAQNVLEIGMAVCLASNAVCTNPTRCGCVTPPLHQLPRVQGRRRRPLPLLTPWSGEVRPRVAAQRQPPGPPTCNLTTRSLHPSNPNQITTVKMARSKAKSGEYDIYATRFVAEGGRVALSVILHGEPAGQYDPVAVQAWEQLHAKYGGSVPL